MLRAAAHRLHRREHVGVLGQQLPAPLEEGAAVDAAAVVDLLDRAGGDVGEHLRPDQIAVALDDRVGVAVFLCLVWKKGGMNAAVDDEGAALARDAADFVAPMGIAGMDADADDIPLRQRVGIKRGEGLVDHGGNAVRVRRG